MSHVRFCRAIEVFKIFEGFDDVKPTDFFTMSSTGLRGHE